LPSPGVGRASSLLSAQPVHGPTTRLPPLHRHLHRASTPARWQPRFGQTATSHPDPVPPSWFCTTWTASSARWAAGLLHPAADPGVHRVWADACEQTVGFPAMPGSRRSAPADPLPGCQLTPPGTSLQGLSASARSPLSHCRASRKIRMLRSALLAGERPTRFVGSDENRWIPPRVLRGCAPPVGRVRQAARDRSSRSLSGAGVAGVGP
jgi:hypothetical protein